LAVAHVPTAVALGWCRTVVGAQIASVLRHREADAPLWTARRPMSRSRAPQATKGAVREIVDVVVPALVIALVFQALLFQPFRIPSESMKPTLLIGDYLFVSKYSYGYSRYSLPLSLPLFSGRILAAPPARGDVAVFRLPADDSADYIKRVIGLPGDRIEMRGGVLHINGEPVRRERIEDYVDPEQLDPIRVDRWHETLPNGVAHSTLDLVEDGPLDNTRVYRVPDGHYFMMGDNRDDSTDSRVLGQVGYVPFENLVGRAEVVFFSVRTGAEAWQFWLWPWTVRAQRLFQPVR
jgi:signal peptidase I